MIKLLKILSGPFINANIRNMLSQIRFIFFKKNEEVISSVHLLTYFRNLAKGPLSIFVALSHTT
jgi:hypothetical protein